MSMTLMVKAMQAKVGNPLRKLVLIKLADNSSDSGECWPSYQHVADQCEIGKSTVKKHIKALEQMGFLRIENRKGPKGNSSNLYHLTIQGGSLDDLGGSPRDLGGGSPRDTRTSHSFEPVNEPCRLDYEKIREIFNSTMTKTKNIVKVTDSRKKKVRKLFTDFELDYEKFEAYLSYINEHPDCQWMYTSRPKTDGSGQSWKPQTFEYFVGEKCFLNAKENL